MSGAATVPVAEAKRRPWKLWLGVAGGVLAIAWLALYVTVGGDFYMTVAELQAAGEVSNVRVGGEVVPDTLRQSEGGAKFQIRDDSGAVLEVSYSGAFPERLRSYERVVASGSSGPAGTFEATEVLVRCPDKLLAEKITNGALSGVGLERVLY